MYNTIQYADILLNMNAGVELLSARKHGAKFTAGRSSRGCTLVVYMMSKQCV